MQYELAEGKLIFLGRQQFENEYLSTSISGMVEIRTFLLEKQEYFRLEVVKNGIVGKIICVEQDILKQPKQSVAFFLNGEELFLVNMGKENHVLQQVIEVILQDGQATKPIHVLLQLLAHYICCDVEYLQNMEAQCYQIEEALIEKEKQMDPSKRVMIFRKELLFKSFRYRQLADFLDTLCEDTTGLLGTEEENILRAYVRKVERMREQELLLRDYLMQLRDIYQQKLEERQNRTMQLLTVVTTFFFPLTLVTGWYGMNFQSMPEVHSPYGYFGVIVGCALLAIGEAVFFRKKVFPKTKSDSKNGSKI